MQLQSDYRTGNYCIPNVTHVADTPHSGSTLQARMEIREIAKSAAKEQSYPDLKLEQLDVVETLRLNAGAAYSRYRTCQCLLYSAVILFIEHHVTVHDVIHSNCTKPGIGLQPDPRAVRSWVWLSETRLHGDVFGKCFPIYWFLAKKNCPNLANLGNSLKFPKNSIRY